MYIRFILLLEAVIIVLGGCALRSQAQQTAPATRAVAGNAQWVCSEKAFPMKPFNGHDEPLVFSPDMSRVALKACDPNWRSNQVIVDGKEGPVYDSVGSVVFSPDSVHVAYGASAGDQHFLVFDGKEGPRFGSDVLTVVFSPDSWRWAYTGGAYPTTVLLDGKKLGSYEYVQGDSLVFSPDSTHFAYWADDKGKTSLYLDGKSVDTSDEPILFSTRFLPNSKGLCYAFKRGGKAYLNFAVAQAGPFDDVDVISLAISPDSKRFACPVKRGESWFLLCDGKEYGPYCFPPHPVFSADSRRLAYVACETKDSATVFLDGRRLGKFSSTSGVTFSPDSKRYAFAATMNGKAVLHADGQAVTEGLAIDQLAFSPDSRRLVSVVKNEHGESILEAGKPLGRTYHSIRSLCFSRDSSQVAFLAADKEHGRHLMVVDSEVVLGVQGEIWDNMVFTQEGSLRAGAIELELPPVLSSENPTTQDVLAAMKTAVKKARLLVLEFRPR